jgi:hypothetical protein
MYIFVRFFIAPLSRKYGWKSVCEIGASKGRATDAFLKLPISRYTIIDPCLDENLALKYGCDPRVSVLNSNSLEALASPDIRSHGVPFDCILIDGDHNWYTVINELRRIRERDVLSPGGYIFFHDVLWPYGRRDMYYQPDSIPEEFRQPFAFRGITRGQDQLSEVGGANPRLANALHEGGPKNGVATAIEDFLAEAPGEYRYFWINLQAGLGVLQRRTTSSSTDRVFRLFHWRAAVIAPFARIALALRRKVVSG